MSRSAVTPDTTVNVGGGTWDYGTTIIWNGRKKVWSDYENNRYFHESEAIIGGTHNRDTASPGYWSNATSYGWPWQTGYAYWNNL